MLTMSLQGRSYYGHKRGSWFLCNNDIYFQILCAYIPKVLGLIHKNRFYGGLMKWHRGKILHPVKHNNQTIEISFAVIFETGRPGLPERGEAISIAYDKVTFSSSVASFLHNLSNCFTKRIAYDVCFVIPSNKQSPKQKQSYVPVCPNIGTLRRCERESRNVFFASRISFCLA